MSVGALGVVCCNLAWLRVLQMSVAWVYVVFMGGVWMDVAIMCLDRGVWWSVIHVWCSGWWMGL